MLVTLGFLIASLLGLLVASAFWSRAVRLTTRRLKQSMPVSEPEIKADRDRLRAEYAVRVHKLATQLEQAKLERARQLIEINRRDASISALENDIVTIRADLEENQNARRVLEQTVADRLPKVEARLAEAKRLLFNRDREIAELSQGAKRHKIALEEASSINAQKAAQIDRLNAALTTRGGRRRPAEETGSEGEAATTRAEIEALRTKTRDQAVLIDRLQRRLGEGYLVPASVVQAPEGAAGEAAVLPTDPTTSAVGGIAGLGADAVRPDHERELRALRAKTEDQAGEIARLKAALAAFEQPDDAGRSLRNSRLALKARVGSAEAQAERQAATIDRLRAELAATHDRLARQAAHFMDEMRRIGAGTVSNSGRAGRAARESERRKLVERVAHVRPTLKPDAANPAASPAAVEEKASPREKAAANGHVGDGGQGSTQAKETNAAPAQPVAEMPQIPAIPEERPRLRLLDRITGLAKN
jgi:hypothetical protein